MPSPAVMAAVEEVSDLVKNVTGDPHGRQLYYRASDQEWRDAVNGTYSRETGMLLESQRAELIRKFQQSQQPKEL